MPKPSNNKRTSYIRVLATLLVAVLFVGSCTRYAQKVFYNRLLVTFVVNRVDKFFDLNEQQEAYLTKEVNRIKNWHKRTQMKLYAADIKELRKRIKRGLKQSDLNWLENRVVKHRKSLYLKVIPVASQFLTTVNKKQVDHMAKVLREQNAELDKELKKSKRVRYRKRANKIIDRVENFTGDLTAGQKKKILNHVDGLPDTVPAWLAYRRIKQKEFINILYKKPSKKQLTTLMQNYLLYQEKLFPKKFKKQCRQAYTSLLDVTLKVYPLLTKEQLKSLDEKLIEYQQLTSELARG